MNDTKSLPNNCSRCGKRARIFKVSGLCCDCRTELSDPTPEQIAAECAKIRAEGFNKMRNGFGSPEGECHSVRVYKTPRSFGG